mmetsp:Transcript_40807/g.85737  ORF Transcript_40807/g.85737 Transcript_40807/m.85737 type:complete len:95 (-) Transcript_40807:672-956(-)
MLLPHISPDEIQKPPDQTDASEYHLHSKTHTPSIQTESSVKDCSLQSGWETHGTTSSYYIPCATNNRPDRTGIPCTSSADRSLKRTPSNADKNR